MVSSSSSSMDQSKTDGAGRGWVLIRSHKEWLMHFRHQVGQADATMAEFWAIWLGMKLAWEQGYSKVILESNSAEAVQLINHLEVAKSNCNLGCEVQLMRNMDWSMRYGWFDMRLIPVMSEDEFSFQCWICWQDDLTATLVQQCRQSQYTVQRIIETAGDNEALLFEALNVNDEIQKVLSRYEDLKKPSVVPQEPEPAMIPVAVEPDDAPHVGKEDALIRKPTSSRSGGHNDEMMDDLDEMIFWQENWWNI
ncbi:target of Myb protein 1 [Actinidia rufa]|uniref:Target of Myb protein 1 n=1 Tax=Actinidia rufa TaxID=165716 RepID=A0A7J0GYT3_9ERIC|nr:target of Myb protein 1 [Actinidia rufa]